MIQVFAYNDVNILASGSVDKTIKIWDINTGQCLQTLEGHTEDILSLVFIDDTTLASGSRDGTIRIWNITTGSSYGSIKLSNPVASLVRVNKNRIVSATFDGNISCWEINLPNAMSLTNFTIQKTSRLFILKNKMFAIVLSDGTIQFRDAKNNARTLGSSSLNRHSDHINKIISIDDNTLASCSNDNTIKIWNVSTGHFIKYYCKTLYGHTNRVTELEALNDTIIVSASLYNGDGTVKIWNVKTWECLQTFECYEKNFRKSALATTDNAIITCTGNTLRIINMPTFEQTINFVAQQNSKKTKQTRIWNPISGWFK